MVNGHYQLPITSSFQLARTQTMYSQMQAGFLTRALPQDSFPSGTNFQWWTVDKTSFGFPILTIGTGAHSGATVADLNRVPISYPKPKARNLQLDCLFFKELRQTTTLSYASQPKNLKFSPITCAVLRIAKRSGFAHERFILLP